MNNVSPQSVPRRWLRIVGNTIVCIAILAASAAAIVVINRTEPTAQQVNAKRRSAALVDTVTVERGTYSPQLVVLGTVQPAQKVMLSPRVRGHVAEVADAFVPGGMVRTGDVLLQLDPADFQNALSIRESELQQAQASLEIEQGRQILAEKELALLGDSIDIGDRSLMLREPQLASIKAQLSAAEAAVERAQLDLQRVRVVAPFDAQVLSREVNVGSQVAPGDELGQLVGVDEYWILAAVPVRTLRWVQFPDADQLGSTVTLRNPDAWGPDEGRQAHVTRMIGALDEQSRLARVLITVTDPLAQAIDAQPLILDTLIEAQIDGRKIENVVRLNREYVHDRDTVWVMKDRQLEIRDTQIVFRDAKYAYIRDGLDDGEEVVTTTLATVANGVGLRKITEASEAEASQAVEHSEAGVSDASAAEQSAEVAP